MTEPDILEALTELAEAEIGGPMPKCLSEHTKFVRTGEFLTNPETGTSVGLATNDWGTALSEIARRAKKEILDLRAAVAIYEASARRHGDDR